MLNVKDIGQAGMALTNKAVGLGLEGVGTITGNRRLKEAGKHRQEAGTERLSALEHDAKATGRKAKAKAHESEQRARQGRDSSGGDDIRDASAGKAAAEGVKGAVKQAAGKVTGNRDLAEEGEAQREKGHELAGAAKHEGKASAHRQKAETHERTADKLS